MDLKIQAMVNQLQERIVLLEKTLITVIDDVLEHKMWIQSKTEAVEGMLTSLATKMEADPKAFNDGITRATNQLYSERLEHLEKSNPAVAARLDRRVGHEEQLSDDLKVIDFGDPPEKS